MKRQVVGLAGSGTTWPSDLDLTTLNRGLQLTKDNRILIPVCVVQLL